MVGNKDLTCVKLRTDKYSARIYLNRPEVHNALNDILINELYDIFAELKKEDDLRVVILTSEGKSFCAGADLNWMKSVVNNSYEQNMLESLKLADLMNIIYTFPTPVIARVNGSAIGGGVGLMSVCDIIIADKKATFGLSEVSLGLVPSVISPYVINRIGETYAREVFITGQRLTATEAAERGLINMAVETEDLDKFVDEKIKYIMKNGPEAVRIVKEMIQKVRLIEPGETREYTATLIADLRGSKEAQEGMTAFLEKRRPSWVKEMNGES